MSEIEIPKAYEPKLTEDKIYQKWEESGFFNPDNLNLPDSAPNYSIIMPPPNVTGVLHMGSAMMLVLEDLMIRYYRMKGYRTLWLPGTDHAAIATQTRVEKNLKRDEGVSRHDLGREEFLKRVGKFAEESKKTIINQTKKMGASCDWSREAFTLDKTRNKAVNSVFKLMYDDGLIFQGNRIVNWCPRCASTLADDEVEHKEQKAKLYTFKYHKDFPFTIATTRPETKLGDTAVAVNPNDDRYKEYIGQTFAVDFLGQKLNLKIIADEQIDMTFGTGALGVTPAHSLVDFEMAQKNNLPVIQVISQDGIMTSNAGKYQGLTVKECQKQVVEDLEKSDLVEKIEEVNNNLSVCYRCETTIEPLISKQWFVNVNKKIAKYNKSIKELSIEAVETGVFGREKIKIMPERFEKIYFHWMKNLRDWCISRQIWYGHQIPVWYKEENIYVGVQAPTEDGWKQDEDTLDTWFSSGLWTFSTMAKQPEEIRIENGQIVIDNKDFKKFHPTSVLETMYDILFFWVARMIILTIYSVGDIPFQNIYLHGCVRDKFGDKMSKSKPETCIDPLDVCEKYGTDAVRLSLIIGTAPGNDVRVSEEKIEGYRNFTNKLWNISRYILMNFEFRILNFELNDKKLTLADKWILSGLNNLILETTNHLDKYEFSLAGEKIRSFVWDDFADWYIEICKIEQDKDEILFYILTTVLKLLHPFMPFVTEEIWSKIDTEKLLMITKWPETESRIMNLESSKEFEKIKELITSIRTARAENKIEPAKKINAIIYAGSDIEIISSQSEIIKRLARIENLEIKEKGEKPNQAIAIIVGTIEIYLPLADLIDIELEKKRITEEIEQTKKYIKQIEGKLNNEEFVKNAPEKIVVQEKEKMQSSKEKLEKLKSSLKDLL